MDSRPCSIAPLRHGAGVRTWLSPGEPRKAGDDISVANGDRASVGSFVASASDLQRWIAAGIITADQAARIAEFDRDRQRRPSLLYAIAGVAGLAIAVGIVSIVASNWDGIPGRAKIGIDLVLLVAVAAGVWEWDRRGIAWARETAIVVLWGLVLASIALVGQVYQLGGRTHVAMSTWTVLTAMLMTRAHSGAAASLWILGMQATWASIAVWFAIQYDDGPPALATIFWPPLVCLGLGSHRGIEDRRPALAKALRAIGWTELVLCASAGTLAFYENTAHENWDSAYAPAALSMIATLALGMAVQTRLSERAALLACFAVAHVPVFFSPGDLGAVSALTFIGLWLVIAWLAYDTQDRGLLNLATALVGVRIVIVYFEVFGSLLDTGLGLVSGGTVALLVVWAWTRGRKRFESMGGSR